MDAARNNHEEEDDSMSVDGLPRFPILEDGSPSSLSSDSMGVYENMYSPQREARDPFETPRRGGRQPQSSIDGSSGDSRSLHTQDYETPSPAVSSGRRGGFSVATTADNTESTVQSIDGQFETPEDMVENTADRNLNDQQILGRQIRFNNELPAVSNNQLGTPPRAGTPPPFPTRSPIEREPRDQVFRDQPDSPEVQPPVNDQQLPALERSRRINRNSITATNEVPFALPTWRPNFLPFPNLNNNSNAGRFNLAPRVLFPAEFTEFGSPTSVIPPEDPRPLDTPPQIQRQHAFGHGMDESDSDSDDMDIEEENRHLPLYRNNVANEGQGGTINLDSLFRAPPALPDNLNSPRNRNVPFGPRSNQNAPNLAMRPSRINQFGTASTENQVDGSQPAQSTTVQITTSLVAPPTPTI